MFTLIEARAELLRLLPLLDRIVDLRAEAAELAAACRTGSRTELGGLAELKAAQAGLDELLTEVQQTGVQLKGVAPLLIDFPGERDGVEVLFCWLEREV